MCRATLLPDIELIRFCWALMTCAAVMVCSCLLPGLNVNTGAKTPHVCKEDELPTPCLLLVSETPPRTWGRLSRSTYQKRTEGNTPTYMGKMAASCTLCAYVWKHPHACGEDATTCQAIPHTKKHPHECGEAPSH